MKNRFTDEPISRIRNEAEAVGHIRDGCRQHTITEQTLYRWRHTLGGMQVSDVKRLRARERENAALKRWVGALSLDNHLLRDVLGKQWYAWRRSAPPRGLSRTVRACVSGGRVACWRSRGAVTGGSQALQNRSWSWHACIRARRARRGLATARCTPCERLSRGMEVGRQGTTCASAKACRECGRGASGVP
jgi:putative transposase